MLRSAWRYVRRTSYYVTRTPLLKRGVAPPSSRVARRIGMHRWLVIKGCVEDIASKILKSIASLSVARPDGDAPGLSARASANVESSRASISAVLRTEGEEWNRQRC